MQYAATFDFSVWLQPQDIHLANNGVAHEGEVASRLGLVGIPSSVEIVALATHLELARVTGVHLHVCRVSTTEGVAMIRAAKLNSIKVTADVAINHLHLIDLDIGHFDSNYRLSPPLRTARDRDALRVGVIDGTINAIVSDHTPRPEDAKQLPFGEAAPGASGLETLLSLTLRFAESAKLPMIEALGLITHHAANAAGLPAGRIVVDAVADFCVFDPGAYRLVTKASFKSAGKNSPFLGYELPGVVRTTITAGHIAYEAAA